MIIDIITHAKGLEEEDIAIMDFINSFNGEAERMAIKYRIIIKYGKYPHLVKKGFIGFINSKVDKQIVYLKNRKVFCFTSDGIRYKDFLEIKPILERISQKFEVDIIDEGKD